MTAAGALLMGAAACGDDDDDASTSGDNSSDSGGGGGGGGPTVEISSPADGDTVDGGFDVTFSSSEDLGPTDTGKHHIHLYEDGGDDYEVVESDSFTVDDLDEGDHTLKAVLANADHSETDASDEVTVTVGEGGGGGGGSDDDDGGYDY